MLNAERSNSGSGFGGLAGVRINGIGRHDFAGGIDHSDFNAGTQAGIQSHGGTHPRRRCHQQVVQVAGKDVNRFIFCAFAHRTHQFGFQMQHHLDAPRPAHDGFTPAVGRGVIQAQVQVFSNQGFAVAFTRCFVELRIGIERELQHAFVAATQHCQRTMRRYGAQRFMMIKVVTELRARFLFAFHYA